MSVRHNQFGFPRRNTPAALLPGSLARIYPAVTSPCGRGFSSKPTLLFASPPCEGFTRPVGRTIEGEFRVVPE